MGIRTSRSASWLAFAGLGLGPLAVVGGLRFGHDPVRWEAEQPLIHRADDFVGAAACRPCHADQHASWSRTFHRTMTQRATPETVQGAFDGRAVAYAGQIARPFRRDNRFFMEVPARGGVRREAEVALAVGSRRYQQYFERVEHESGFAFVRLPFLWHIGEQRWLHLNTVFLGPDDADWNAHRTRWNDNCILCHNTGPKPGEIPGASAQALRRFDSEVAQLGIACESCHGPGAEHVARYRDPLTRYRDYAREDARTAIVQPEKLDRAREVSVCGQCHGQRLPHGYRELARWLTRGPTFRAGELLEDHAQPVERDTPSPKEQLPDLFRLRFWGDGTARLTAYEYQGIVSSPCYRRGSMTCESCHEMHGGDPRGMIEPRMRGNDACNQCHTDIARDVRGHTKHDPERSGSSCMACHMPRMVYGILTVHRSHRIENPDPARDAETGRPHACTTCHLDKSLVWSAEKMAEWWGGTYRRPTERLDRAPVELPDSVASLLAGDAVQRVVYAWAAGRPDAALDPDAKAFLRSLLAATLADGYPAVRWMARQSLLALEREQPIGIGPLVAGWDTTDFEDRGRFAHELFDEIRRRAPGLLRAPEPGTGLNPDFSPDLAAMVALLELQDDRVISIGE